MESLSGKITGQDLLAEEFVQPMSEIESVILDTGQTLSDLDLNQLGKGIAGYVANGNFYTDSGIADAYVLSKIGSKQTATAYTDGFAVTFVAANRGTGAATINVAGLGVKSVKLRGGNDPFTNDISNLVSVVFDVGNDWFELIGAPTEANVQDYGAIGDGSDELIALNLAVASGATTIYLPNAKGEVYGVSAPWVILTQQGYTIRTDNPKRSSGQVLKALSPMESVIQLLDGSLVPGQNIITMPFFDKISIDCDNKAVFGLACGKPLATGNQLVKMLQAGSLSVARGRFGVLIGGAGSGIETDSAGYGFDNLVLEENTDGAILVDTGNGAAIRLGSATLNGNGFNPTADAYNPSGDGFNAKVIGGELNMISCTTAGAGATQPATADIIASAGDIRIMGLWSDTHGLLIKESGSSDASHFIGGIRHKEGGMNDDVASISLTDPMVVEITGHPFEVGMNLTFQDVVGTVEVNGNTYEITAISANTVTFAAVNATGFTAYISDGLATTTPISIQHTGKMVINGGLLNGRIQSNEGNSGSITTIGVNFVSGGPAGNNAKAYEGTLKTNQKAIISINNFGNRAQIAIGGGNVDMDHKGAYTPQVQHIGPGSGATGPTATRQVLGPESTDSGFTETLDTSTGSQRLFINSFESTTAGLVAPILVAKDTHIIDIGGGTFEAFKISRNKFASASGVVKSVFQTIFTILQGASDATLDESVVVPPRLDDVPTFNSGDYWEGGFFYHNSTKTMKLNVGGLNFAPMGFQAVATNAELNDISHAINTSSAKETGYTVWNTDKSVVLAADGNANGSAWLFLGNGTVSNTPV